MNTQTEFALVNRADRDTVERQTAGQTSQSDPRNANTITENSMVLGESRLVRGIILETCCVAYAYKVAVSGGREPLLCCSLQTGGGNSTLLFDSSFYSEGTSVLVAICDKADYGIILGAIPFATDGKDALCRDVTSHASQNYPDESDKACLSLGTKDDPYVGIYNFASGQPVDTTSIGSSGHTSVTGVKSILNPFMAITSVNDFTGVWQFVEDSLLRLSGINVQLHTAGRENEYLNDNGEYIEYEGSVLYPWEQLGKLKTPQGSQKTIEFQEESDFREPQTWKSFVEPEQEKAKPFHRRSSYGGWLGQGKFTQIVAPDPDKEWSVYGEKEKLQGLIRLCESFDGWLTAQTSGNVFIGKQGLIPSVCRVERPDDTSTEIGDNPQNYQKTNQFDIVPEVQSANTDSIMESVMGLPDTLAYEQNFKQLYPFLQHQQDYYVPEDSQLNSGLSRFANFSQLTGQHLISVDSEKETEIDDNSSKRKSVKVNASQAGIATLNNGSEVLFGGCGEEIRMAGGSMFFDAPGDIWLKAGRKIVLWAGDDIEIRSKGHIDISTTDGSVRLKAEKKLCLLGGNNGTDGVLIESKGETSDYDFTKAGENAQFGGIVFKSKSDIAALGSTIYIRSGAEERGKGIFLDAQQGQQPLYTLCSDCNHYVENSLSINFSNIRTGTVNATTSFTEYNTQIPGYVTVQDAGYFGGSLYTADGLYAVDHVYTGEAKKNSLFVGDYSIGKDQLRKQMDELVETIQEDNPESATKKLETSVTDGLYSENKIGNEQTIYEAGFSFRTQEEYEIPSDFAVYEARWQNISANTGSTSTWVENYVRCAEEETYPYPGKDYYTSTPCYTTQPWTLTNYSDGLYKDRWENDKPTSQYANPQFGVQEKKTLNEYPVIG